MSLDLTNKLLCSEVGHIMISICCELNADLSPVPCNLQK